VAGYHRKPCQRIELPQSVKLLYRKPKDEEDWTKLADFRKLLRRRALLDLIAADLPCTASMMA